MVVDIILLQNSSPVVIEIDADLLATVDAITSESGLAAGRDPHASQRVGVDLIAFDDTATIVMLRSKP